MNQKLLAELEELAAKFGKQGDQFQASGHDAEANEQFGRQFGVERAIAKIREHQSPHEPSQTCRRLRYGDCTCGWRAEFGEPWDDHRPHGEWTKDSDPERMTDAGLLYELAGALRVHARDADPRIPKLIEVACDRAAMFLRLT